MVACEVGKDAACECQTADTLLCYGVRRAFHKGILASCFYHLAQQEVELDGVGSGVVGRNSFVLDIVADGRQQAALMSELAEHII